jgi:GAF domain-containing protein
VCGTAVERRASQRVEDVHAFPGHIACDSASRSELVVPLMKGSKVLGVLDLDSPRLARFDADDQAGLERIAALYVAASAWPEG